MIFLEAFKVFLRENEEEDTGAEDAPTYLLLTTFIRKSKKYRTNITLLGGNALSILYILMVYHPIYEG